MNKNKIIAAVDLGSSKVATLIAQVSEGATGYDSQVNIVGVSSVASRGIKKGQIVDLEEAVETAIESVEAAERMAGYNLDKAFVSLGGASIASENSQGVVAVSNPNSEIVESDVDRAIEAASAISLPSSREIIHILPKEFVVDGEGGVKDPLGMSGIRLEVETHLITASSASIKNIKKVLNEVGIDIIELVYTGLASSEAVLTKTEKELGCVLVDIGGGTTSIAVYIDGALSYSSVIPIGAKNVTNDLAIGLRVSLESAEKIKVALSEEAKRQKKKEDSDEIELAQFGIGDSKKITKKTLTEGIIRPRLNEIFTMVKVELEKENLLSLVPSGVIVTGGGAETIGLEDSAKRMLSLPARIGKPRGLSGLIDDVINPAFSTCAGLILYAVTNEVQQPLTSFSGRFKLSTGGIMSKLISSIKDLLP